MLTLALAVCQDVRIVSAVLYVRKVYLHIKDGQRGSLADMHRSAFTRFYATDSMMLGSLLEGLLTLRLTG